QLGQAFPLVTREKGLDRDIVALDKTVVPEALPKCTPSRLTDLKRLTVEIADHRQRALLRARRQRHCRCCTAEQRDELAPPHQPSVVKTGRDGWKPTISAAGRM